MTDYRNHTRFDRFQIDAIHPPLPRRSHPLDLPTEETDYGVFWRFWIGCLLLAAPLWLVIVALWWLTSTLVQARGV